jgi:hypothetical protein
MSQVAATACIQPPMFETTFAVQTERNKGCSNGAHGD